MTPEREQELRARAEDGIRAGYGSVILASVDALALLDEVRLLRARRPMVCPRCDGDRRVVCPRYAAEQATQSAPLRPCWGDCEACKGWGQVECSHCNGSGAVWQEGANG